MKKYRVWRGSYPHTPGTRIAAETEQAALDFFIKHRGVGDTQKFTVAVDDPANYKGNQPVYFREFVIKG